MTPKDINPILPSSQSQEQRITFPSIAVLVKLIVKILNILFRFESKGLIHNLSLAFFYKSIYHRSVVCSYMQRDIDLLVLPD